MKQFIAPAVAAAVVSAATADIITQWNFDTQNTTPSTGSGVATLIGGTTATFATGIAGSGTFGWNVSTFPASGTADRTAGAQYAVSTVGYESIILSYDLRHSNTSANTESVQVSLDGTNWTEVALFTFTPAATGTGDTWYSRSITLSLAGANDNANFAFRVVAAFDPTAGNYLASRSTSTYGTSSTWRFDNVTVSGTLIPAPGAVALLGVAGVAAGRRRRAN